MNEFTLTLKANRLCPGGTANLDAEKILCNDVHLPGASNYHGSKLWVIGHECGPIAALWADHEQDALDELINQNLGDCLLIEEKDATEDSPRLGNAGEPANLDYTWMAEVEFDKVRDFDLLMAFAEAKGANVDNLDQI